MVNLGNAWHVPANPEPRGHAGMRDPVFPTTPVTAVTISTGNQFQGGPTAGNQLQDGSNVLFKRSDDANWTTVALTFDTAIGNNKYFSAPIPTTGLGAGVIVQYYLRIAYDDHDTTFLRQSPDGTTSIPTGDEQLARTTPFTFTMETPDLRGRWGPVFPLPDVGIHAHVLPDGRVLMWGRRDRPDQSLDVDPPSPLHVGQPPALPARCTPFVWNPATGQTTMTKQPTLGDAAATNANLFCSGHSFLPDGRLLVAGGHRADSSGLSQTSVFDPATDTWTAGVAMTNGRWYPTLTSLPDGDVLILSGSYGPKGAILNNIVPQLWMGGTLTDLAVSPAVAWDLYPRMHVASNGRVVITGSLLQTWMLDVAAGGTWTPGPLKINGQRDYAPSVLYDVDKVLYVGGGNQPTAQAELLDLSQAAPAWAPAAPMSFPRRQHNATVLADGSVLVTGGTRSGGSAEPQKFNNLDPGQPIHVAELWDPVSTTWTQLAAETVDRCYHSTAVLLRDGTVLSAGGGEFFPVEAVTEENDPADSHRDAQVFSPPYLFKGARPVITTAPVATTYGATFHVATPQSADIEAVTWLRLSSVTHSFNTGQRYNRLAHQPAAGGLDVTAPASAAECPPGHYMLFLITSAGVPSIAEIMRIGPPHAVPALPAEQSRAFAVSAAAAERPDPQDVLAQHRSVVQAATGTKVVIGLTGTCPYGIAACWGGAYEALTRLDGVELVDPIPDGVGSTATVYLVDDNLPSLDHWREQFRAITNESYLLRGIEVTLTGTVRTRNGQLQLDLGRGRSTVGLTPLNPADTVQWDPPGRTPRAVSPEEKAAHVNLAASTGCGAVTVTGPLLRTATAATLGVRTWTYVRPEEA